MVEMTQACKGQPPGGRLLRQVAARISFQAFITSATTGCNSATSVCQVERHGTRCAAFVEVPRFDAAGGKRKQRADLVRRFLLAREDLLEHAGDALAVEPQRFGRDLDLAAGEVIVHRPLGCAAMRQDLVDSGAAQAGLLHQQDRRFQDAVA